MTNIFELTAELRKDVGKGASRRLRRQADQIPAIIYGAGKQPTMITLPHNKIIHALENEAFYSHILDIKIGDQKKEKVILKDLQRHPYKPHILHIDFLRIKADTKITMNIPLHFINEETCIGVKNEGGVVVHHLNEVNISCLPADLPEFIEVDLAECKLNDIIHLSNLQLPKGAALTTNLEEEGADLPVAGVITPRVAEVIEETAPEAAETEVITEAKEDKEAKTEAEKPEAKKE